MQMKIDISKLAALMAVTSALIMPSAILQAQEEEEMQDEVQVDDKAEVTKLAIELGAPFCDNAILQREMKIPVWGWSEPGTKVTVEFAGQKKTGAAGKDCKWVVELDELKANAKPAEMLISDDGGKKVTIKNILVGEVWMASGQSNMQWKVGGKGCDTIRLAKKFLEQVKEPVIREFEVTSVYAMLHPMEKATGSWKNGDYMNYSAVSFAFAHKLYEELQIPIGILNCSFSQTSIQAWTPREGFKDGKDEYTQAIYRKIVETHPSTPEHKIAWEKFYQGLEDALKEIDTSVKKGEEPLEIRPKLPGNMAGNRDASWMFNGRLSPVIPYALRGAIWNQGYANINEGLVYYNNLHSLIRGWRMVWNRPELPVYFHQFYCPSSAKNSQPSIGEMAEMRMGAFMARDIPDTGMASQIDVQGAIHYGSKTVPGQRLALHALKKQYGKNVVADGPIFKSYKVDGDKVTVEFDNAEDGLLVAETGTNAAGKSPGATGFSNPKIIENGDSQVEFFYLAGKDRVWHPAVAKIDGSKVVVISKDVKEPCGVTYGTGGIGFDPNFYNKALLPMSPFIYFDNKPVTSKTWPGGQLKIAGVEIDPNSFGIKHEYRKMPLLSSQFVTNAVLQAGQPVTIWGSAIHDWGYEAKGTAEIKIRLAPSTAPDKVIMEKTIPVTKGMRDWRAVLPPMEASAEPKTLKVTFTINGELAHERVCTNVVIGDVWYVAATAEEIKKRKNDKKGAAEDEAIGLVRMMTRHSKSDRRSRPLRYTVSVSSTPENKYASVWESASGSAAVLGERISAKTGKPVGIIFMQSAGDKDTAEADLKMWIAPEYLDRAPSLMPDYEQLASIRPGTKYYDANVRAYIGAWKKYWSEDVPVMINSKAAPEGVKWGNYPRLGESVKTDASQVYNVMVSSFMPANIKGIIFISSKKMVEGDQGLHFGQQMSALANCWKEKFACPDPVFIYTVPDKALAPKISEPKDINGMSKAVEVSDCSLVVGLAKTIEQVMTEVYK